MKKILAVAIALTGLVITAEAQVERKSKQGMHQKHEMMQDLNLTETQKQQLQASRDQLKQQMQELKSSNLTPEQAKEKRKDIMATHKAKMKTILTPDQQAKMAEKKKEFKGKGKGMKGHGMKGGHARKSHGKGNKMEKLDLTPAQQSRMKAINDAAKTKREAVKSNTSLSEEARKQQMTQIRKETMEARKQVLTAEQLKKMGEFKKNRPAKGSRPVKK